MKTSFLVISYTIAALMASSCRNPLDVGGTTIVTVENKPPITPLKITYYGNGEHYSGKSGWVVDPASCTNAYIKIDTTRNDAPILWMEGDFSTDCNGAEFTGTGQQIAAALRLARFRLDSLPLGARGYNLIDPPSRPLGAEFLVDCISNRYDSANRVWRQVASTEIIVPNGSGNAYCSVRLVPDSSQTLVWSASRAIKAEILFRLHITLQEPKNIEASNIFINGTIGVLLQY